MAEESSRVRSEIDNSSENIRLAGNLGSTSSSLECNTGSKRVKLDDLPQSRCDNQHQLQLPPPENDVQTENNDVLLPLDLNVQPVAALSPSEFVQDSFILPKFGITSVCGKRSYMEDEVSVHRSFCGITGETKGYMHFFGVFDGHGCSHVATLCKERMHVIVKEELLNEDGVSIDWEKVMKKSFMRMDNEAVSAVKPSLTIAACECELISPDHETVGSTAVVAVVTPDKIIVANCGDSGAILCHNDKVVRLSTDHKPDRPDELKRIEDGGGYVLWLDVPRVYGMLAMSRAIGDKYLKPFVISEPEVMILDRSENDQCLILGSDGLWDVIPINMTSRIARMCLNNNTHPGPDDDHLRGAEMDYNKACSDASMMLTKAALTQHSSDNISVVVVDLRRQHGN